MKKVNSFEHACAILGEDTMIPEGLEKHEIAHRLLTRICKAMRKINDFKVNPKDRNQRRYYPVFDMDSPEPGGFAFLGSYYVYWFSFSSVGSRLSLGSTEEADFMGTEYLHYYKDLMVIPDGE